MDQPKRYLRLLREIGVPARRLANLLQLEDYIALLQNKDFVLGAAARVVEGEDQFGKKAQKERYERACHHLRNALLGICDPVRVEDPKAIRYYRYQEHLYIVQLLCLILVAFLSLFEQPSWCYGNPDACTQPPLDAPPGSVLYTADTAFLNVFLGLGLELVAYVLLFLSSTVLKFFLNQILNRFFG